MEAEEAKGIYTGDRLFQRRPDTYKAIVELLAEGRSHRDIEKVLGVARRTIGAVEDREPEAIKARRDQRIRKLNRAADYQVDRLVDHPDLVPMQYAADTAVKLSTHAQLLSGQVTARIEHMARVDVLDVDDWERAIANMLPADVIEIESIPISPLSDQKTGAETDLGGGKRFAIGGGDRAGRPELGEPGADEESEDRQPIALVQPADDTGCATLPATKQRSGSSESERLERAAARGRGGSTTGPAAPNSPIQSNSQKFSGNGSAQS